MTWWLAWSGRGAPRQQEASRTRDSSRTQKSSWLIETFSPLCQVTCTWEFDGCGWSLIWTWQRFRQTLGQCCKRPQSCVLYIRIHIWCISYAHGKTNMYQMHRNAYREIASRAKEKHWPSFKALPRFRFGCSLFVLASITAMFHVPTKTNKEICKHETNI